MRLPKLAKAIHEGCLQSFTLATKTGHLLSLVYCWFVHTIASLLPCHQAA